MWKVSESGDDSVFAKRMSYTSQLVGLTSRVDSLIEEGTVDIAAALPVLDTSLY